MDTLFWVCGLLVVLAGSLFWLWVLVDCANREANTGNTKVVWVLIILIANFPGALVYWFVRRPQRFAELGR
jgi:Phospholipase_D-nuclease N-terminal